MIREISRDTYLSIAAEADAWYSMINRGDIRIKNGLNSRNLSRTIYDNQYSIMVSNAEETFPVDPIIITHDSDIALLVTVHVNVSKHPKHPYYCHYLKLIRPVKGETWVVYDWPEGPTAATLSSTGHVGRIDGIEAIIR